MAGRLVHEGERAGRFRSAREEERRRLAQPAQLGLAGLEPVRALWLGHGASSFGV
jgi:hypothetical protein